jgi:hypothetical protein
VERRRNTLSPNGSRLSCGRNARRRKAVEPQTKRLAGEATQFSLLVSARQLQAHVRRQRTRRYLGDARWAQKYPPTRMRPAGPQVPRNPPSSICRTFMIIPGPSCMASRTSARTFTPVATHNMFWRRRPGLCQFWTSTMTPGKMGSLELGCGAWLLSGRGAPMPVRSAERVPQRGIASRFSRAPGPWPVRGERSLPEVGCRVSGPCVRPPCSEPSVVTSVTQYVPGERRVESAVRRESLVGVQGACQRESAAVDCEIATVRSART